MEGLLGLTNHTNKRESAVQDIGMLERMSGQIENDKNKEIQAQQQQQLMYERLYAKTDQLLEKDRNAVNKRFMRSQQNLQTHLGEYGGSKADFFANGGYEIVDGITKGIETSEEMSRYRSNKENLVKIFEAQEKGFGHLLSPNDLKTLEDYNNNEEGAAISYSGLMSEVKLPPSDLFDYGKQISPINIMSYDSNMVKIMGNYKIAYPDRPEPDATTPEGQAQIVSFMRKMGYGGLGSNVTKIKEAYALEKERAKYKKESSTKSEDKNSFLFAANEAIKMIPDGLTVKDLNTKYKNNGLVKSLTKDKGIFSRVLGDEFKEFSRRREASYVDDSFLDLGEAVDYLSQPNVGLRESYKLGLTQKDQDLLSKEIFGTFMEENSNKVKNFRPDANVFAADGTTITEDDRNDADNYTGDYEIMGMTTAIKSKVKHAESGNDEPVLLVNALDNDGNFDEKATNKMYSNRKGELVDSDAEMVFVMALRGADGDLIYKQVDMNKPGIQKAMSVAISTTDDITSIAKQNTRTNDVKNQVAAMDAEEQVQFETTKVQLEDSVFQDPIFKDEGAKYFGAGSAGQQNRYDFMKSFYMAFDHTKNAYTRDEKNPQGIKGINPEGIQKDADDNQFSAWASVGGIEEKLKDYSQNNSEEGIIDLWLENMNSDLTAGKDDLDIRQNNEIAARWKQMLGLM